jgi:hypothetical protein
MLMLRPGVVATIGDLAFRAFALLSAAIGFVLNALLLRGDLSPVDVPAAPTPGASIRTQPTPLDALEWPEWLASIARIGAGVFVILIVLYLLWRLLMYLGQLWARPRGAAYAPIALERLDEDWTEAFRDSAGAWFERFRTRASSRPVVDPVVDARSAYRALLRWARRQGLERRRGETTQQFLHRLERTLPDGRAQYAPLTQAYEAERYGRLRPSAEGAAELSRRLQQLPN